MNHIWEEHSCKEIKCKYSAGAYVSTNEEKLDILQSFNVQTTYNTQNAYLHGHTAFVISDNQRHKPPNVKTYMQLPQKSYNS